MYLECVRIPPQSRFHCRKVNTGFIDIHFCLLCTDLSEPCDGSTHHFFHLFGASTGRFTVIFIDLHFGLLHVDSSGPIAIRVLPFFTCSVLHEGFYGFAFFCLLHIDPSGSSDGSNPR